MNQIQEYIIMITHKNKVAFIPGKQDWVKIRNDWWNSPY